MRFDRWALAYLLVCAAGCRTRLVEESSDDLSLVDGLGDGGDDGAVDMTPFQGFQALVSGVTVDLQGVWGTGPADVYVVGRSGTILHYDGSSWTQQVSPLSKNLFRVFGATGDVYAVGETGTVLHSDGTGVWTAQTSGTTHFLFSIWAGGTSASPFAVAVGQGGVILRTANQTGSWVTETSGTTQDLVDVWGVGDDVWAVGATGTLLHSANQGMTWAAQASTVSQRLAGITGTDATDLFAVGNASTIIHSGDGANWSAQSPGVTASLFGVFSPATTEAYVVGDKGTVLHTLDDGQSWIVAPVDPSVRNLRSITLNRVWASSQTDVFIVGGMGTILHGP